MTDSFEISTLEELRSVIPISETRQRSLEAKVLDHIDTFAREFIAMSPMAFVGAATASGHSDVSPKGDPPGFVAVENEKTLLFPERKGNGDARILRSLLENDQIGLLFVIPGVNSVLRVTGTASLTRDPKLLSKMTSLGKPALLCVRITVEESYFHCPRAFNRSHIWHPEKWIEGVKDPAHGAVAARLNSGNDDAREDARRRLAAITNRDRDQLSDHQFSAKDVDLLLQENLARRGEDKGSY